MCDAETPFTGDPTTAVKTTSARCASTYVCWRVGVCKVFGHGTSRANTTLTHTGERALARLRSCGLTSRLRRRIPRRPCHSGHQRRVTTTAATIHSSKSARARSSRVYRVEIWDDRARPQECTRNLQEVGRRGLQSSKILSDCHHFILI